YGDRTCRSPPAGRRRPGARLPGADPARGARTAGGPGLPVDLSVRTGPEGAAQYRVLGVACLHGGVAGLRIATDLQRAVADRAGTRGSGEHRRRIARAGDARGDLAADPVRIAGELAAGVHDLRAR